VATLDDAPLGQLATVNEQRSFAEAWLAGSYYHAARFPGPSQAVVPPLSLS
jgi:hypothetical protein